VISDLLDRQLAGDVGHKPSSRQLLLSARPEVILPSELRSRCPVAVYSDW